MISTNVDITATITTNFLFFAFAVLLTILLAGIYSLNKNPNKTWSWDQLITDHVTKKASLPKLLQLLGGLSGTFIVVWQTLQKTLSSEMFLIYLGALGVSEGFSKWVSVRYQEKIEPQSSENQTQ